MWRYWGLNPPKCILCMACWAYKVGLWSLCHMSWHATKVTVIMVTSIVTQMWWRWYSWYHQCNPDVSVHVGSAKVTLIMVTSLVTQMWSTIAKHMLWGPVLWYIAQSARWWYMSLVYLVVCVWVALKKYGTLNDSQGGLLDNTWNLSYNFLTGLCSFELDSSSWWALLP